MPLIPIAILLLLPLIIVIAMPFSLLQRYRMGTARRPARHWVATVNLVLMLFSVLIFVWAAALTNFWIPKAFAYAASGLAAGAILGGIGVAVTRWEETARGLYYTPNQWLILFLVLAITTRILYSFARGWNAWAAGDRGTSWLAQSGAAGSLAVGAMVLGYYLIYAAGLWRRVRQRQ